MIIQEFIPLAPYTTFQAGGSARYFIDVRSLTELKEAIQFSAGKDLPFFVLGGGSNVLIPDEGFAGVVIHMIIPGTEWEDDGAHIFVTVGAGVSWDEFVEETVRREYWGVENLSGIPGTVGASPIQNIGAYGVEAAGPLHWVEVYDSERGIVRELPKSECGFGYRESLFKHKENDRYIITRVKFHLKKNGEPILGYKDIERHFHKRERPTVADIRKAILETRAGKFPDLQKHGTAGSFFKNPILPEKEAKQLLEKYPDAPHYLLSGGSIKFPAGWILDHVLEIRGVRKGNVGSWGSQALVLVNYGGATTKEIKDYAREIQYNVAVKTNILLEPEVVFVE